MTASRTCRACGAALTGDVTWCVRCYEPVRRLTPRAPQLAPLPTPVTVVDEPEYSRWKGGVNTFGPAGRLGITAAVLLMAPTSLSPVAVFVLWPCYLVLAVLVLRSVWKKDRVMATPAQAPMTSPPGMPAPEPHRVPIPHSTVVAWGALLVVAVGAAIVWTTSGDTTRALFTMGACIGALVLWIRSSFRT